MLRRFLILAMAAVALAACSRQPTEQQAGAAPEGGGAISDPAAVVRPLYDPYLANTSPPDLNTGAPWSTSLAGELGGVTARAVAAGEPVLNFDPIVDGQDFQLSNLTVTTEGVVENSHATVRASFDNLGARKEVLYDLIWENGAWRVDNMRTSAWDLRQLIASPTSPS